MNDKFSDVSTTMESTFQTLIENKGISPAERIYYLKKYLGSSAKEAVEGFFILTDTAVEEAKQLLEESCGGQYLSRYIRCLAQSNG